jgi:hypothetical protein
MGDRHNRLLTATGSSVVHVLLKTFTSGFNPGQTLRISCVIRTTTGCLQIPYQNGFLLALQNFITWKLREAE